MHVFLRMYTKASFATVYSSHMGLASVEVPGLCIVITHSNPPLPYGVPATRFKCCVDVVYLHKQREKGARARWVVGGAVINSYP